MAYLLYIPEGIRIPLIISISTEIFLYDEAETKDHRYFSCATFNGMIELLTAKHPINECFLAARGLPLGKRFYIEEFQIVEETNTAI